MRGIAAIALVAAALLSAQPAPDRWKPIEFLFGNWVAQGGGTSTGQGSFTFEPQINRTIVVRRNFAEYSSGPEAGTRHDDLMIVYADPPGSSLRAIYFDSEDHVIHYTVKTPSPNVAIFESDGSKDGPRFRLTYALRGKNLDGKFEVAAPGGDLKPYLSWTSVKQ
jgi:hypothetical protein